MKKQNGKANAEYIIIEKKNWVLGAGGSYRLTFSSTFFWTYVYGS